VVPPPAADDPTAAIRAAILRIAERREQARLSAGRTFAGAEQVRAAMRDQRRRLHEAAAEIADARATAERAAREARSDATLAARTGGADPETVRHVADAAAEPYERTMAGFDAQRAVVERAGDQLDALSGSATEEMARTRQLLDAAIRTLDDALREQLRLLLQFERAERARLAAAARPSR
jgi:methyl-accepting chemotaxis protein